MIPWQPTASLDTLKRRAAIVAGIRRFFAGREVLEVDTPLLAQYSVTDPHMEVITADNPSGEGDRYYLQTSPEYAMKRLLAAGSGPIYQICKAFRKGERGSRHNPEFTMLEWYRPGFSMFDLMDEIEALLNAVTDGAITTQKITYRQVFLDHLDIDPLTADCRTLEHTARRHLDIYMQSDCRDDWLHLLMAEVIEPKLAAAAPTFIYHYPASQAALACLTTEHDGIPVAQRFELYAGGLELANGYFELTDADEQRRRFDADNRQRAAMGKPAHAADVFLLAAMEAGLPACAGVALGLDRLFMLALNENDIARVQAFIHSVSVIPGT